MAVATTSAVGGRRQRSVRASRAARAAGPRFAPGSPAGVVSGDQIRMVMPEERPADEAAEGSTAMEKVGTSEIIAGEGRCFRCIFDLGIGLRSAPSVEPKFRTGEDVLRGEVFEIKSEVRKDGRSYFELLDGRGWVFDWNIIEGERVELLELAAQLYTVAFPDGVFGIQWSSDTTMRFSRVKDFNPGADATFLAQAGLREGDTLVMINEDPVVGMPFGQVLEQLWATGGRQPGSGTFYRVVTEGPYGIGIRETPDINGPRTGLDLFRGSVFQVDEVIEEEGSPTYLHLADGRGWVFDMTPVDPKTRTVENIAEAEPGCTLTMWRGDIEELAKTIGLKLTKEVLPGQACTITVMEEGQPLQRLLVPAGTNLRKALVDRGFQVYQQLRQVFNCNAQQLCGTCVLQVLDGGENLTVQSLNEARAMAANPRGFRLCCGIDVYGDVAVRLRPQGVQYGGGTS